MEFVSLVIKIIIKYDIACKNIKFWPDIKKIKRITNVNYYKYKKENSFLEKL